MSDVRPPIRPRSVPRLVVAAAIAVVGVTACSDSGGADGDSKEPVKVTIEQDSGDITASEDIVSASRGQDITFVVSSDAADEIHVHSEPEQEFEVEPGDGQEFTFSVDAAGQYAVESHELGVTILKLQIS